MKAKTFLGCLILPVLVSCGGFKNDSIRNFIPGTYTRFTQHEYGTMHDTVLINLLNRNGEIYEVTTKWRYARVLDGKPIEPEYKKQVYSAFYSDKNKVLQVIETGEIYSFDSDKKVLYAGSTKYQKIK